MHNPRSSSFLSFSNILVWTDKTMGKLNASVGENILFRFRRDENASALSGVFVSFPFGINQLVVENII